MEIGLEMKLDDSEFLRIRQLEDRIMPTARLAKKKCTTFTNRTSEVIFVTSRPLLNARVTIKRINYKH